MSLKTGGSGNGPAGNAVSGAVLPAGRKGPWADGPSVKQTKIM
ncbi:hypothetical protein HMPREF3293_02537 [Christensenella minuta]|uniref:Uncharacterized protein n=1 Tax=Christensenella minuta TaxID=626937 RepID=A0A136Q190_9FIRM|nr:hypothetical protein HMPREF3293_02537 [Christensenella minuta]